MPINIFSITEEGAPHDGEVKSVAWLCDTSWELPTQLYELERWLETSGKDLPIGSYVADIGFEPRTDAGCGGGTLSVSTMQTLVALGIEVWFSQYPG